MVTVADNKAESVIKKSLNVAKVYQMTFNDRVSS